jgi:predicted O-methyltransferase YrrM
MDYVNYETPETPSHYEHQIKIVDEYDLKRKVFKSMKELHGWCSEEKANILVDMILLTKPEKVVEIGVWGGKSLVPMAYAVQANGNGQVYGIDPWSPDASSVGMDGVNLDWWSHVDHEGVYQGLVSSIAKFGLQDHVVLLRETSAQADPIEGIGLLHIDGNHSDEASYIDVTKWVPHVKKGGIIVFDDVNWSTTSRAVTWLNENCVKIAELRGDNIWAIWVKQ